MPETRSFHEDLGREHEVKGSSDRAFGFTVGGILLLISGVRAILSEAGWLEICLSVAGLLLVTLALAAPPVLAPLNKAWTKLGLLLFRIVNPVIMGLIFVTTVAPIGLVMRIAGLDPLRLKFDRETPSYWIERNPPGPPPDSMKNQF